MLSTLKSYGCFPRLSPSLIIKHIYLLDLSFWFHSELNILNNTGEERERMSCTKVIDLSLIEKICGDRNLTLELKQSVFDN